MELAIATPLGLMIGSFLNVVAYRLPRGESLVWPGSHCTSCGADVKPYDNIPVLSWLVLRGRCRDCHTPISARYPLVEALTAALAAAVVLTNDGLHDVLLGLALVALLVPIALIDLDHRIIPNRPLPTATCLPPTIPHSALMMTKVTSSPEPRPPVQSKMSL